MFSYLVDIFVYIGKLIKSYIEIFMHQKILIEIMYSFKKSKKKGWQSLAIPLFLFKLLFYKSLKIITYPCRPCRQDILRPEALEASCPFQVCRQQLLLWSEAELQQKQHFEAHFWLLLQDR